MAFFAVPYQIRFDDTMAYGSHHYLTNFKFQCVAREKFVFEEGLGEDPALKQEFDEYIYLTQEGYTRNLAPVGLAEKVAILLSYEDLSLSRVRLCFRVVRFDGVPVSCSYQTQVCISRRSERIVPFPVMMMERLRKYQDAIHDPLQDPDFAECAHRGGPTSGASSRTTSAHWAVRWPPHPSSCPSPASRGCPTAARRQGLRPRPRTTRERPW